MAKSGVIVTLGHGGKATLYRGLLKPEDARAIKADAKHKAKGPKAKPEEKGMSQSLVESLTSHLPLPCRSGWQTHPRSR